MWGGSNSQGKKEKPTKCLPGRLSGIKMLSTTNTDSPKKHPDFKDILLSRHDEHDWICVSAFKVVNGKFIVSERFCNGVDEAANLIERSYQREDIGAIWTNIQRLKPGPSRRKKGETIDAYTGIVIDIDRRWKMIHEDGSLCKHSSKERKELKCGGFKCNATGEERQVLYGVAEKVNGFMAPLLGTAAFSDSGNGYHIARRCKPLEPQIGHDLYSRVLALLRAKFEQPDDNMEIDVSLADDTQVVTVWGTWNRKYPDMLERPQRQSKVLFMPTLPMQEISEIDLELFLLENAVKDSAIDEEAAPKLPKKRDWQKANPVWLENYGVPHLVEWFSDYIKYEDEGEFEKSDGTYHPLTPCYAHKGEEDGHEHDKPRDSCIIVFKDGGIGLSCWSKDFGLKSLIKLLNRKIVADGGEKYPYLVFAEESDEDVAEAFGIEEADVATPVGELCYRQGGCQCGKVHVVYVAPPPLFEEGEFIIGEKDGEGLIVTTMDKIKSRRLEFLWEGRIPLGKGVVMHGPPGSGKSNVELSFIAMITTGRDWPDGAKNTMGARRVMMAATEDDYEDTIKPRLMAMGADMSKIVVLKKTQTTGGKRKLNLDADAKALLRALREYPDVVAVFFDPITGFYGDMDGNDNKRIRPVMEKLAEVCRLTRVNIFGVIHENRRGDAAAIDKILGAGALAQVFRVALRFSTDPKGASNKDKIMATTKSNLTKTQGGLRYRLSEKMVKLDDGFEQEFSLVEWGEVHDQMSDDVIADEKAKANEDPQGGKLASACAIAESMLLEKGGVRLIREIKQAVEGMVPGISEKTMKRIKGKLGLKTFGKEPGPWWWALKDYAGKDPSGERQKEKAMAAEEVL
jgi:putative DNA primase/helicase